MWWCSAADVTCGVAKGKGAAGGGRYASAGSSSSAAATTLPKRLPVADDNVSTPVPYAQQQRIDEDRSHAASQHKPPDTPSRAFLRKVATSPRKHDTQHGTQHDTRM